MSSLLLWSGAAAAAGYTAISMREIAASIETIRRRLANRRLTQIGLQDGGPLQSKAVQEIINSILGHQEGLSFDSVVSKTSERLVFRAAALAGERHFVIKCAVKGDPHSHMALFNEAAVLGHLNGAVSPAVRAASVTPQGYPYLVRDWLSGSSMDRVILSLVADSRVPAFSHVRDTIDAIMVEVETLHELGVVHGDLKPANILAEWQLQGSRLTLQPSAVKLLDFESASLLSKRSAASISGLRRGTPFFMAPERYAQARYTAAADVYSISALAALLLTGRPVRPGSGAGKRIPFPPVREAIRRGMSVDVRARYQSVSDLRGDLTAALDAMVDETGNSAVDWPTDSNEMFREIEEEARTIALEGIRRFGRVASGTTLTTIDGQIYSQIVAADALTRDLMDLMWVDGLGVREAAGQLGISQGDAGKRLDDWLSMLNNKIRETSQSEPI